MTDIYLHIFARMDDYIHTRVHGRQTHTALAPRTHTSILQTDVATKKRQNNMYVVIDVDF